MFQKLKDLSSLLLLTANVAFCISNSAELIANQPSNFLAHSPLKKTTVIFQAEKTEPCKDKDGNLIICST